MLTKKSISTSILVTCIIPGSGSAFAADESISSMLPIWPFLAIVAFIFIFRKQLNCVPPLDLQEESPSTTTEEQLITGQDEEPEPKITPDTTEIDSESETEINATVKADDNIIDLKDNSQQCQGSTAKGTRCKRKTTLEDASVTIDGKIYLLIACRQHNNERLKPFAELIK